MRQQLFHEDALTESLWSVATKRFQEWYAADPLRAALASQRAKDLASNLIATYLEEMLPFRELFEQEYSKFFFLFSQDSEMMLEVADLETFSVQLFADTGINGQQAFELFRIITLRLPIFVEQAQEKLQLTWSSMSVTGRFWYVMGLIDSWFDTRARAEKCTCS